MERRGSGSLLELLLLYRPSNHQTEFFSVAETRPILNHRHPVPASVGEQTYPDLPTSVGTSRSRSTIGQTPISSAKVSAAQSETWSTYVGQRRATPFMQCSLRSHATHAFHGLFPESAAIFLSGFFPKSKKLSSAHLRCVHIKT